MVSKPTFEPGLHAEVTWRGNEIDHDAFRESPDLLGDELAGHIAQLAELEKFIHDSRIWARLGPRSVGQIEDAIEDIRDATEGHYRAKERAQ